MIERLTEQTAIVGKVGGGKTVQKWIFVGTHIVSHKTQTGDVQVREIISSGKVSKCIIR